MSRINSFVNPVVVMEYASMVSENIDVCLVKARGSVNMENKSIFVDPVKVNHFVNMKSQNIIVNSVKEKEFVNMIFKRDYARNVNI